MRTFTLLFFFAAAIFSFVTFGCHSELPQSRAQWYHDNPDVQPDVKSGD